MKLIPKYQNAFGPILYNNFLNILYNIPGIGDEIKKRATRLGIGASKYFNKHTGEFDLPTVNIVRPKGSNVSVEQPDALKFRTDASGNFVRVPSGGSNLTDMRGREYHMKLENDAKLIQEAEKQGLAPVFNEDGDIIDFDIPSLAWKRNDRPLSGADPIAKLYVETVALNPVFKGIGNAGKWLWGRLGNTGKAISLGVRKVTANDGKIFEINKPRALASLDENLTSRPPALKVVGANRAAVSDIKAMNKYHSSNVAEYNTATGSNVRSVPFREDYTGTQTKILPDDEFNIMANQMRTNSPNGNVENIGGLYNRADDTTYLRMKGRPSTAYHEFLHRGKYGTTNPEVTEWRIQQLVNPELTKGMSEASKKYYLSAEEFPVHLRQQGESMGIKVGLEFPGEEAFNSMIENNSWGGASLFSKGRSIGSPLEDKKLLWRALNGTLFGGAIIGTTLKK